MKLLLKPTAVFAAFLIGSLSAAAAQTPAVPLVRTAPALAPGSAPTVVSTRTPLSREELAKYQLKDAGYQTTQAAGADDRESLWIIAGAVVVVGVVILVASGGSGSGSGGGY